MRDTKTSEPIGPDELDRLFGPHFPALAAQRAALAVSGGSDSTALMVLSADWLTAAATPVSRFTVLTVDHGLRPQSASEAQAVAAHATALGFRHATLTWTGPKPKTGVQAAARQARYRLMAAYMREHEVPLLLTAHTAEDQAETFLMRLARGSGLDGLSAMASSAPLDGQPPGEQHALRIVRPLLKVSKVRLRATLEQRGIGWIEDPSNQSPVFERTRLRAARAQLDALGLTPEMLSMSARRLQRARAALEEATDAFCAPQSHKVVCDPCGFFRIDAPAFRTAAEEVALRVLARAVAAAGGSEQAIPLARLEIIVEALRASASAGTWTIARAMVVGSDNSILVEREPGREPLRRVAIEPGTRVLWDGRFWVDAGGQLEERLEVGPLGEEGVREVLSAGTIAATIPRPALRAVPALWRGNKLFAVPLLDFWTLSGARHHLSVSFVGLDRYASAGRQATFEDP